MNFKQIFIIKLGWRLMCENWNDSIIFSRNNTKIQIYEAFYCPLYPAMPSSIWLSNQTKCPPLCQFLPWIGKFAAIVVLEPELFGIWQNSKNPKDSAKKWHFSHLDLGAVHILRNTILGPPENPPPQCNIVINWVDPPYVIL